MSGNLSQGIARAWAASIFVMIAPLAQYSAGLPLRVLWLGSMCSFTFQALTYQTIWQRGVVCHLRINAEPVTVVVSAFMLGLGVGRLLGG